MKRASIDRFFSGRMFRRQYFPALISAVVLSLGDVADGLVLGNSVGYIGLAAIALTMPVAQVFNVIMNGLGIGGSVRFAQQMAQGKRETARSGFQGIVCTAALAGAAIAILGNLLILPLLRLLGTVPEDGALFEASRVYLSVLLIGTPVLFLNYVLNYYLRSDDLEKQASLAFTAGNIMDISLNVILVLVLRLGVAGASVATVVGQTVSMVISVFVVWRHKGVLKFLPMKPDFSEVLYDFRKGFSASVEFLYSMIFLLIANRLLIRSQGGMGVAILDVVLSVSYFTINLCDAAAKSSLPVISTYYGEHNEDGTRWALCTGILYTLITNTLFGIFVFCFPTSICCFFGLTEMETVWSGQEALRWYSLSIPLASICTMLCCFYEARQQEKYTFLITTVRGLLPVIFSTIFFFFAPHRVWQLYLLTELLTLVIFGICRRFSYCPPFDRNRVFRETIYSNSEEISKTTEKIEGFCRDWNIPVKQSYMAAMAVEELCVATLDNGFRGATDGFVQITMIALEDGSLELHIRDNADAFNPLAMELKQSISDADERDLDALGIATIKKKARDFSYRHYQGFNTVIFRF